MCAPVAARPAVPWGFGFERSRPGAPGAAFSREPGLCDAHFSPVLVLGTKPYRNERERLRRGTPGFPAARPGAQRSGFSAERGGGRGEAGAGWSELGGGIQKQGGGFRGLRGR